MCFHLLFSFFKITLLAGVFLKAFRCVFAIKISRAIKYFTTDYMCIADFP